VVVPFPIVAKLWCNKLNLPKEPILSLNPILNKDDNERQDVATVLFRLIHYQGNYKKSKRKSIVPIPLSSVFPRLKLQEGQEVYVDAPASCTIEELRTRVEHPDDVRSIIQNCPQISAFINGKNAAFADSFIVLKYHNPPAIPDAPDYVIILIQSKRKETPKKRKEVDKSFSNDLQKALLNHQEEFTKVKMKPVFIYITDAENASKSTDDLEELHCIITAKEHTEFYGGYRTMLRQLRNVDEDDPIIQLGKQHNNKRKKKCKKVKQPQQPTEDEIQQAIKRVETGLSIARCKNKLLQALCAHYNIPITSKATKTELVQLLESTLADKDIPGSGGKKDQRPKPKAQKRPLEKEAAVDSQKPSKQLKLGNRQVERLHQDNKQKPEKRKLRTEKKIMKEGISGKQDKKKREKKKKKTEIP
jgi:hypothetical protein